MSQTRIISIPDTFYSKMIKDLPLEESLVISHLVTDAVLKRMNDAEKIQVILRMAGCDGAFLLLGVPLIKEDAPKLKVRISQHTVRTFNPEIYPEIKNFIMETTIASYFDEMVIANQDKDMAKEMISANVGDKIELFSIFSYSEKLEIIKNRPQKDSRNGYRSNEITIASIFNEDEQKEVFKELLKMNDSGTAGYLKDHWEKVQHNIWDEGPRKDLAYLEMLETIPSEYAPICYEMPKKTRLFLTKNGVSIFTLRSSNNHDGSTLVHDFTRAELLERYDLFQLKDLMPSKLTEKELIKYAEVDSAFLKANLELFPKKYLAEKFKDEEVRKAFIGNRVKTVNKIANKKLESKLAS